MSPALPPTARDAAAPRTFWQRWRLWLVAGGVLGLTCCGGAAGLLAWVISIETPHTPVFTEGFRRAVHDEQVKEALGEPLTHDASPRGRYDADLRTGGADQTVTIHGPKGSARLHVKVHGNGGREWVVDVIEVDTEAGLHIDLVAP